MPYSEGASGQNGNNAFAMHTGIDMGLDLLVGVQPWETRKIKFYTGCGLATSGYYYTFTINAPDGDGHIEGTDKLHIQTVGVPFRVGYLVHRQLELLVGATLNFHRFTSESYGIDWYSGTNGMELEYHFQSGPFRTIRSVSANLGVQYHTKGRWKFAFMSDVDFGQLLQTDLTINVDYGYGVQQYAASYTPSFNSFSIGAYYTLFKPFSIGSRKT